MEKIITDNLEAIRDICRRHHVARLWVFGSAATGIGLDGGLFGPESDVDLLVEYVEKVYDFENFSYYDNSMELHEELEAVLGRKVDLVAVTTLTRARFIKNIKQQMQSLYVA